MDPQQQILELLDTDRWTQPQLAAELGVSQPTISRWKHGQFKELKSTHRDRIQELHHQVFGQVGTPLQQTMPDALPQRLLELPELTSLPGWKKDKVISIFAAALALAKE